MHNKTRFALSAAAGLGLAAMAAPAMAADVVYQEPAAPSPVFESAPISSWAGPYVGAQVGYGFSGRVRDDTGRISTDGFLGGAFGGFNFQNGQFVYGVEGDVNYSGVDGSEGVFQARSRYDGSIRGRVGAAVTEDILVYGTAGVAAESLRVTHEPTGIRDRNTHVGYTVGAGVDAKLTDDVFARAEYRYTDYGSETYTLPGIGEASVDSSNHRVTVGLGIKF